MATMAFKSKWKTLDNFKIFSKYIIIAIETVYIMTDTHIYYPI